LGYKQKGIIKIKEKILMIGTFGQQIGSGTSNVSGKFSKQQQQQQTTPTRTERLIAEAKRKRFEELKAKAELLGSGLWKDVTEEYQVPVYEYKVHGHWHSYDELSHSERDHIRHNPTYYDRKTAGSETQTSTREFTNADYGKFYETLSPELKQFFLDLKSMEGKQVEWRTGEKALTDTEVTRTQQKLIDLKTEYEKDMQKIDDWWDRQSRSYKEKHPNARHDRRQDVDDEYDEDTDYLRGYLQKLSWGSGQLAEGKMFAYKNIQDFADEYGDYKKNREESQNKWRDYTKKELEAGNIPIYKTEYGGTGSGNISGFIGAGTQLPDYLKNQTTLTKSDLSYYGGIIDWSKNTGFTKLPTFAQNILNPTAVSWQSANPTEKLQFDMIGNVTGVESGVFQQSFSTSAYDKKVIDFKTQYEAQQKKDAKYQSDADALLGSKNFGEINTTAPALKWYQKTWDIIKTGYLASPFGAGYGGISESKQKELTEIRENRIAEAFKPERDIVSPLGYSLPVYKFFSLPFNTSYKAVKGQNQMNYEEKVFGDKLEELDKITAPLPNELKPYVLEKGLAILKEKGLDMQEVTTTKSAFAFDNNGKITGTTTNSETTMKITDPAFERRLSQNMLEWEKERNKKGIGGEIFLAPRIVASKVLENYLLWMGGEYAIKGVIGAGKWGYKALGGGMKLEKAWQTGSLTAEGIASTSQKMKVYKLTEGFAVAPAKISKLWGTALGIGVTGLYGYAKVKQFQQYNATSPYGKEVFWLETAGELGGIEMATGIGKKTYDIAKSNVKNWNIPTIKEADLTEKGFYRENKLLGGQEKIYMRRYEGFKLSSPKSWLQTLEGYEKGQFTGQVKKIVSDEVSAYYKYGGDVDIYNKMGEYTKTIKATPFPYDNPATHYDWITRKNILEYGTGKYKELPINVKEYKGYVYSATANEWEYTEFKPDILYKDGKAVANLKGAVRFGSGKGLSEGFLRISRMIEEESGTAKDISSPTIYANYLKDIKINKATGEIRGITGGGQELKFPKYLQDTGILGTGNIPLSKREVEATYEFEKAVKLRTPFAIRRGLWKIPVVEEVVGSSNELKALMKSTGISAEITPIGYSSLPSSASSINKAIYSIMGSSKPSSAKSYKSSIMSEISNISSLSEIPRSKVSEVTSRTSRSSTSSFNSRISEIVSDIMSNTSYTSKIPKYKMPRISPFEMSLSGKIRKMKRMKRTPEIQGLFPDFTARSIDLKPQRFGSVESAIREIKKLKTGFEIQRGGRLKTGFKMPKGMNIGVWGSKVKKVGDMDLLKGIMA
jgi:hypothetical protein